MEKISEWIAAADAVVWGPFMLTLILGTGIFLTVRLRFLPWRNLGYALRLTFRKETRTSGKGDGEVSPFSALMTALASTIGTGNIVGVATAMVSGGPGALVWMWIAALFGMSSKFAECMLAIRYRSVNAAGEMSGGPMYTMRYGFRNQKLGAALGWLFALFATLASFGIGNMAQANSISEALHTTFAVPVRASGIVLMLLAFVIIVGGIKKIAGVSAVIVPCMAVFYIAAGLCVVAVNRHELPEGLAMILQMAFSREAVGGGLCGSLTAGMAQALHYGVARGVFSNEAGMGSAAISAAAASTDSPVEQGYVNMTGTFWDTIVVCTITGLCIAASGVLGTTELSRAGRYTVEADVLTLYSVNENAETQSTAYRLQREETGIALIREDGTKQTLRIAEKEADGSSYVNASGTYYHFKKGGVYEIREPVKGAKLTILAFEKAFGKVGAYLVCIGIVLFAFSTILGWEYQGEKAFEYLSGTHRFHMAYRIVYACFVYAGATMTLDLVWNLSDIANALMALPNLICLLALSGTVSAEALKFEKEKKKAHRSAE